MVRDRRVEAGCPIILAGTVQLTEAVDDHDLFYGQFSSRIALRYDVSEDLRDGLGFGLPGAGTIRGRSTR